MPAETLTDGQVLVGVRDLVGQGKIAWTFHARERMAERGVDSGQVRECLLKGSFSESPVIPNRGGPIQYTFTMSARIDRENIPVVASLFPESKVLVITVLDPN